MAEVTTNKWIELIDNLVSNFDPTPTLVNSDFPLRWETSLYITDYDFESNYLQLDKNEECASGEFLKSVGSAVVLNREEDGSFEFWDGAFMIESHTWCSQLNTNEDFPSFSLLKEKFNSQEDLIAFLFETYG